MASALFATSRNDNDHWGEGKVYMRKAPKSTAITTTTTTTSSSSNPNPRPYNTAATARPNPKTNNHHHQQLHLATGGFDPQALELSPRSEDCSSFSHQHANSSRPTHCSRESDGGGGGHVVFNVSTYSKKDLRELKRKLVRELERVRSVATWVESRDFGFPTRSVGFSASSAVDSGQFPPFNSTRSDGTKQKKFLPENNHKIGGSGTKRPLPSMVSPREPKRPLVSATGMELEKILTNMFQKCEQILIKLMKHKSGWIFNAPVDVVTLQLHDYHQIIKHPMDLGTVNTRLRENLYLLPKDFAADVRLTFNNALLYNPKGHEVYKVAERLLRLFEDLYGQAEERFEKQQRTIAKQREVERQKNYIPATMSLPLPSVPVAASVKASTPRPSPPPPPPQEQLQQVLPPPTRPAFGKKPKPKAKDPNKREMSFEEKQKLSVGLESLPYEKMAQVLQIVRRKNPDTAMHGDEDEDEIELDFEALNTETLWELDRFVYNCKKNMNKIKRQEAAISAASAPPPVASSNTTLTHADDKIPPARETPESAAKKNKRPGGGEQGEEDVDIGDEEMPSVHFPPVEIEKDAAGHESSSNDSSSDSSSSSSSSGSDSRSSSDSESDADEGQSPAVGLRPPP